MSGYSSLILLTKYVSVWFIILPRCLDCILYPLNISFDELISDEIEAECLYDHKWQQPLTDSKYILISYCNGSTRSILSVWLVLSRVTCRNHSNTVPVWTENMSVQNKERGGGGGQTITWALHRSQLYTVDPPDFSSFDPWSPLTNHLWARSGIFSPAAWTREALTWVTLTGG